MHGRLKVKTSEQQAAEKKAARAEKMKIYQGAMSALLSHRLQHSEAQLKMTSGLLHANPDITTLWNIRKEALIHLMSQMPEQESKDGLLRRDMDISQDCLMTNPKSYGAWHHRCWCILQMSKPNWTRELNLCNKYLALDERNFHVWDYRRFIVQNSGVSQEDELNYSTDRIHSNFSNYSAWHYRSKLLPQVFPASGSTDSPASGGMTEIKCREELDLVQNAAFTDPDDSSAWFYHKWLLLGGGRNDDVTNTLTPIFLKFDVEKCLLTLAVTSPIDANKTCRLLFDGHAVNDVCWSPADPENPTDTLWTASPGLERLAETEVFVVKVGEFSEISVSVNNPFTWMTPQSHFRPEEKTVKVLEEELENCSSLLDLEPDSKWTLYARILIMKAIDPEKYHQDIIAEFSKLAELDAKRRCYYEDMRSRQSLEVCLKDPKFELDLSSRDLTRIYFKERLSICRVVDLSKNKLSSVDGLLPYLVNCTRLCLDENLVSSLDGFRETAPIEEVSIRHTPLAENLTALEGLKLRFPSVKFIVE